MSKAERRRTGWMGLRLLHIAIAVMLVFCIMAPYLESSLDCQGSVFTTGHDTETTVAILLLILELVLSLAGLLVAYFSFRTSLSDWVAISRSNSALETSFALILPDPSPPLPLRI